MTNPSSRPTSVNPDLVGHTYAPVEFPVYAVKLREFATATGATDQCHFTTEAAQLAGYRDIIAVPTYAVVPAQAAEAAYLTDPASGIDFTRVVHAEETFSYFRPIIAGDILSTTITVTKVLDRGPLTLVTTTASIRDAANTEVCVVTSTLAVRGD